MEKTLNLDISTFAIITATFGALYAFTDRNFLDCFPFERCVSLFVVSSRCQLLLGPLWAASGGAWFLYCDVHEARLKCRYLYRLICRMYRLLDSG